VLVRALRHRGVLGFSLLVIGLAACSAISGLNQLVFDRPGGGGAGAGGHGGAGGAGGGAGAGGGLGGAGGSEDGGDAGDAGESGEAGGPEDAGDGGSEPVLDGGDGGVIPVGVGCAPGRDVAIGVAVRGGAWLDQFALLCATPQPDGGPPSAEYTSSPTAGGTGGVAQQLFCPSGQVVVEYQYTHDSVHTYQVYIGCQTPALWKSMGMSNPLIGPVGGGPGGSPLGLVCGKGYAQSYVLVDVSPDGQYVQDLASGSCFILP